MEEGFTVEATDWERMAAIAAALSPLTINEALLPICHEAFRGNPELARDYWRVIEIQRRLGEEDPSLALDMWERACQLIDRLDLRPPESTEEILRSEGAYHDEAAIWCLLDREKELRLKERADAAILARFALVAAEQLMTDEHRRFGFHLASAATDLYALSAAVVGNHARIEGDLERAASFLATAEAYLRSDSDQWIAGEVFSLKASLLENQGKIERCREALGWSAQLFKDVDEIRRCEVTIQKALNLFSFGINPERLLEAVIRILEGEAPRALQTLNLARLNLLHVKLYRGASVEELRRISAQMETFEEPMLELSKAQNEALMEAMLDPLEARARLERIAEQLEELGYLTHAAVAYTHFALVALEADDVEAAQRVSLAACKSLEKSGFKSHWSQEAARVVFESATARRLQADQLRRLIWAVVCPNARPTDIAWPGVRSDRS